MKSRPKPRTNIPRTMPAQGGRFLPPNPAVGRISLILARRPAEGAWGVGALPGASEGVSSLQERLRGASAGPGSLNRLRPLGGQGSVRRPSKPRTNREGRTAVQIQPRTRPQHTYGVHRGALVRGLEPRTGPGLVRGWSGVVRGCKCCKNEASGRLPENAAQKPRTGPLVRGWSGVRNPGFRRVA